MLRCLRISSTTAFSLYSSIMLDKCAILTFLLSNTKEILKELNTHIYQIYLPIYLQETSEVKGLNCV